MSWAIFLSVAVEIAALAALAGVSAKFGKFIYIPFGIVTLIQFIGNFFYSFSFIETSSQEFKTWIEMVSGVFEPMGIEPTDVAAHKRILAFFTGGLLPFISLTFAHMLIVYSERDKETPKEEKKVLTEDEIVELSKEIGKMETIDEPVVLSEEKMGELENFLKKMSKESDNSENKIKRLVYSKNG
jgi:hypothetical protein